MLCIGRGGALSLVDMHVEGDAFMGGAHRQSEYRKIETCVQFIQGVKKPKFTIGGNMEGESSLQHASFSVNDRIFCYNHSGEYCFVPWHIIYQLSSPFDVHV